jgi:tyrosine aminotransferase/nicotianamine aminotransferase
VAEVARKLGILVIADEVYGKLVLGSAPFIPMGVFGHIAPVLSIGSLSKSWIVPGWRLGWVAVYDPKKILQETKVTVQQLYLYATVRISILLIMQCVL